MKYVYGPVPSRRLGLSLGISPIPKKTCNYSCIYCQLGRTNRMTNVRRVFFKVEEILLEVDDFIKTFEKFDVITIVGEGEPTLFLSLKTLIVELKKRTDKPIAVITNGALLYDVDVQNALSFADIVLPSLDAFDAISYQIINRPHGDLVYSKVIEGLISFSNSYKGQLWLEIMLINGINDTAEAIQQFKSILEQIEYHKLYINTPIRPPAEPDVKVVCHDKLSEISEQLGGISIDLLASKGFYSMVKDDYDAILSIIKRHPMNQFEILSFLNSRKVTHPQFVIDKLDNDKSISKIDYMGFSTYRLR